MAKKKPAVKIEWERLPLVEDLVWEIVGKHHRHLEGAKIICLGKPKASKHHGKVNIAKARCASAAMKALVKDDFGELHYLIEIGLDVWDVLDAERKRIVLDHELCHFVGLTDNGKWETVGHDVEEFTAIVRRHGAWTPELRFLAQEFKQLSLELQPA